MKVILNPEYIEYKVLYNTLAYYQQINENLIKLLIKVNNRIYFPEFIHFEGILIKAERINDIVCNVLRLTRDKCDEINFQS